jgi:hypothetical protein
MPGGRQLGDDVAADEAAAAQHQHALAHGCHGSALTDPRWPRRTPNRVA